MNIPDNYIKLKIPGEKFWAESISPNSAIIKNILVNPEYGLNDVVAHDGENVTCVLVKKTETVKLTYSINAPINVEDIKTKVQKICKYFEEKYNFETEPAILGLILLAIPVGITKDAVLSAVENCPESVLVDFQDQDDDEDDDPWM